MDDILSEDYTYLDWAATAPLCDEALDAMRPFLVAGPASSIVDANANSLHTPGRTAFAELERARKTIAAAIGASRPAEVILTGGATEADNAALFGMARAAVHKRTQEGRSPERPRIITTKLEHEAILKCATRLEQEGFSIAYAPCDRYGFVDAESLERVLDEDTVLVSIQAANSEIGTIQPIGDLVRAAHSAGALFHTDAVQAFGKIPFDVSALGVDAATFSAHKISGPKGIGALYLKARTPFDPYLMGGGQESGRRSGTQNVCAAVGFATACEVAARLQEEESVRQRALRDRLYSLMSEIPRVSLTVPVEAGDKRYLPNIVHVLVEGMESETLVLKLDGMGFGVSGGSACSSHSLEPSHVLKAIGIDADRAYGALRVSFGRYTEVSDIERFAQALAQCIG